MRVVAKRTLDKYGNSHPDIVDALMDWYYKMRRCQAKLLSELRQTFGTADAVGDNKEYTCFSIKGNHYRLITKIHYVSQIIYIHEVLTHDEYTIKFVNRKKRR